MDEPIGDSSRTIDWVDDVIEIIDQRLLPDQYVVRRIEDVAGLVDAISSLAIRGAPALGVAGAMGVALAFRDTDPERDPGRFQQVVQSIREARPTAVNLARGVDRAYANVPEGRDAVLAEALAIRDEEVAASWSMSAYGADLVTELVKQSKIRTMTICNTGGLATVERGTALGVIQEIHEQGRLEEVIALETRPLLQGARLTSWELSRIGAPYRLVVDSAAPFLISRGATNIVLTGADRIAANGDTANKIGTYSLALAARRAAIPFVVVAPESTVDSATGTGAAIEIEDRGSAEVLSIRDIRIAPRDAKALNPAFDVTPVDLITALVTDRRVIRFDLGDTLDTVPPGARRGRSTEPETDRGR